MRLWENCNLLITFCDSKKKFVINYIEEDGRVAYHNFEIFVIGL